MRLVGLISGGKDSVFNMLQCIAAGHEIVAVANIEPLGFKEEMDSYMYQTVGHQTLSLLSAAISLPIYRQKTKGIAICKEKVYVETPQDEVEDLYMLISKVKDEIHIDGVSVGAIASDYQRTRVENVCMRLNLKCFAYLWKRDQEELLQEMIDADLNAIVVKVAALGLKPETHLGASIKDLQSVFVELSRKFGINVCGEGGEYETLTIDCPLYHRTRREVNQIQLLLTAIQLRGDFWKFLRQLGLLGCNTVRGSYLSKNTLLEPFNHIQYTSHGSEPSKFDPKGSEKIEIIQSEKIIHSDDAFAPVGILNIKSATLENKIWGEEKSMPSGQTRLDYIRSTVKPPLHYIQDCLDDITDSIFLERYAVSPSIPPEVLPFPFGSPSRTQETLNESKTALMEYWKTKSLSFPGPNHPNQHVVTFSPSSLLNIDSSVVQLNHSTGWCCIGNVSAPSVKEGLGFVRKHLQRYQYEFRDIVSITLYVKDLSEWSKINKIYSQSFPSVGPPARACVAVPLQNDSAVTITVVAHRLVSRTQKVVHHTLHTVDKDFVHVQSISHWAPANIGPYSQCIRVGEIVYVSGQIPLIPGTMELLNGPILHQCRLTLRHIFRILRAVNENYNMSNVMYGICFVTSEETAGEVSGLWSYITKNEHAPIAIVVVLSLPKNAQLEWQVLACGYNQPQVSFVTDTDISDEFLVKYKRCLYADHNASALVCNVSFVKKPSKRDKTAKNITSENIITIMRQCLQMLRGDIGASGTPLCIFTVFFKASEMTVAPVINETLKSALDFKVVITCIPVIACEEADTFLTVTGVCH